MLNCLIFPQNTFNLNVLLVNLVVLNDITLDFVLNYIILDFFSRIVFGSKVADGSRLLVYCKQFVCSC